MRKKPNLIPRLNKCAALRVPDPCERRGRWRELLPGCGGVHVEIGCGKGGFTAQAARLEPETLFLAIERVPEAIVVAMERAMELEVENIRFLTADASALTEFLAPGEASRIYLNFCDPWPKAKNAKRRLTSEGFVRIYREVLAAGGEVRFKTDNIPLFDYSLTQFELCGFTLSELSRDLHAGGERGVLTDYEKRFISQGVPINYAVFVNGEKL